jgi:SAM-dependent methyltransferase
VDERLHVVFIAAAEVGGGEDARALAVERAAAGHGDVCNCEADADDEGDERRAGGGAWVECSAGGSGLECAVPDCTHGYDPLAKVFAASRSKVVGVPEVQRWVEQLRAPAEVLDVGCGPGVPLTAALIEASCRVWAVDASPQMVALFTARFPDVPVACEPVESMTHFGRQFDGVLAWGLVFLLEPDQQRAAIARLADAVASGGQLLFTAPAQACEWRDVLTGEESRSLGAPEYRRLLERHGLAPVHELDDSGENHYYVAARSST